MDYGMRWSVVAVGRQARPLGTSPDAQINGYTLINKGNVAVILSSVVYCL